MDEITFRRPKAPEPQPDPGPVAPSVDDHARERICKVALRLSHPWKSVPPALQDKLETEDVATLFALCLWIGLIFIWSVYLDVVFLGGSILFIGKTVFFLPVLFLAAHSWASIVGHYVFGDSPESRLWPGSLEKYVTSAWANPEVQALGDLTYHLQRGQWWFTGRSLKAADLAARVTPVLADLEKNEPDFGSYTFDQKVEIVGKRVLFLALLSQ